MRHLLLYAMLSVMVTPIVALQDQITGRTGSDTSVKAEISHSLDRISIETARFLSKVENRVTVGVRELLK